MKSKNQQKRIGTLMLSATLALSSVFGNSVPVSNAKDTFTMTKKVTMGAGETFQLSLKGSTKGIRFSTNNKKVVAVSKKGKIKANKKGTAVITAKVKKKKKTCKVVVKAAAKGIEIENGNLQLAINEVEPLAISFTSGYSKSITFRSEDTSIATVSKKGLVCGKKVGTTTITATTFNGKQATISCTVGGVVNNSSTITATPINTASVLPNVTTTAGVTATPTIEPTKDATMNGTKAPEVTEEPTKTPNLVEETAEPTKTSDITEETTEPTKTPDTTEETVEPTQTPDTTEETAEPTQTPDATEETAEPTQSPDATAEPTKTPDVTEETEEPTKTPDATEETEETTEPTKTPNATEETAEPTETPFVFDVATASAVISKIEDGNIYINENSIILDLTDNVTYWKQKEKNADKVYQIGQEDLHPGDVIVIGYSGLISNTYPVSHMADCQGILVIKSEHDVEIPEVVTTSAVISKIEDGTIYVNEGATALELTDCIVYQKEYEGTTYELMKAELFPGDEIIITYNGAMTTTYPINQMLECEGILVTKSEHEFVPMIEKDSNVSFEEDKIQLYDEEGNPTISYEFQENTIFMGSNGGYLEASYYVNYLVWDDGVRVHYTIQLDEETKEVRYVADTVILVSEPKPSPTPVVPDDPNVTVPPTLSPAPLKPVIYLYPEETTEISVDLDVDGGFSYTYPYSEDGHWDVIAQPDGTLTNKADGLEYSYIFWEGNANDFEPDFSKGFCVKGGDITKFFQKVLPEMGLTPKEYNEFIVYWAPLLQKNPYNLISFQGENYEDMARLTLSETPDSMLRVYMAVKPLDAPVEIEEQTFETFERKGFTVVEWGGGFY